MRALSGLLVSMTACVIFEAGNDAPPERNCGKKGATPDDYPCRCRSECQRSSRGTSCLREDTYGYAMGVCARMCKSDRECESGYVCTIFAGNDTGTCNLRCTEHSDCLASRLCVQAKQHSSIKVCREYCDESSDCESGECNLYSGFCLANGEEPHGDGLNAACSDDDACRSENCSGKRCTTYCDPAFQRCPEGGVCMDGVCENACTLPPECAEGESCMEADVGTCSPP